MMMTTTGRPTTRATWIIYYYYYYLCLIGFYQANNAVSAQEEIPAHHFRKENNDAALFRKSPIHGLLLHPNQFLLNYTNFNHGSFGACPRFVLNYQAKLQLEQEQQPDIWFRNRQYQLQTITRARVAEYIGVSPGGTSGSSHNKNDTDGLVLVESASTAVNSIMRSFPWKQKQPQDIILLFSVAYPMVHNTANWLAQRYGLQVIVVPILFPILRGDQDFIDPMKEALKNLSWSSPDRLKMVVLDHMVSTPAVKEPIRELAAMVKAYNPDCFVLVDGAHIIGQVRRLDLAAIGNVDAYLSNGHKWLYSAKGSAFLWINTTSGFVTDTFPEPTVISSANPIGSNSSISLVQRYSYVSTKDYTAFLTMDAALDFRRDILGGEEAIYQHCRTLALDAKHFLMGLWNISTPLAPDDSEEFMINIPLPTLIFGVHHDKEQRARQLQEYLLTNHGVYIIVLQEPSSGIFYTRLSAQVYLELLDFKRLGQLVLDFGKEHPSIFLSQNSTENYRTTSW